MKEYIGVKIIKATPAEQHTCTTSDCKEGIEGYKVVYEDGYTSWSPKSVFEEAYTEVSEDKKLTQDKLFNIFEESNAQFGQWMPTEYVNIFIKLCLDNNITYKK